jgi:LysR family hydrogen peroxide-inducible transcriptional activator
MSTVDLSALTLTQLRYLDALERHRSFRAAAEHCRVSQPGLSMQVQKLEELVGFTVFDRSLNPVVPTERGARLIEQARAVLREMNRLHDVIAAGEGTLSGSYRLGVIPTLIPSLVPPLLKAFGARYPNAELSVEEVKTEVLLRRLLDGSLHGGLAATPLGVAGIHETPLLHEELLVYLSPGHPLCRFDALREEDLLDQRPWLLAEGHCFRGQTLHLCERERGESAGAQLRFQGESFEALVRIVDAGMGFTVLPELVVRALPDERRRAQVRAFAAPVPVREISLLTSRVESESTAARALASCIVDNVQAGRSGKPTRVLPPLSDEASRHTNNQR